MAESVGLLGTGPFLGGSFAFGVLCSDPDLRDAVDALFHDCHADIDGAYDCFIIQHRDIDDEHVLDLDETVFMELRDADTSAVLSMLVTSVNHHALEHEPERLHLHAAAVRAGNASMLISASRDTGKTTTVAHLLASGSAFLTDEAVAISADDVRLRGLHQAAHDQPGGGRAAASPRAATDRLTRRGRPHRPHPSFMARRVGAGPTDCALVVVLTRPVGLRSDVVVSDLHAADVVVRHAGDDEMPGRYGRDAVVALARLAATTRCVHVAAGSPAATAAAIVQAVPTGVVAALDVEVVDCEAPVAASTVTVILGGRAVVHDVAGGAIVALDEAATHVWLALGGQRAMDFDPEGPVLADFVGQLRQLGMLDVEHRTASER